MSFDWSTFILEVVNFLVLVWLLKRFLYRPVLSILERRQREVQKTLEDAQAARGQAQQMQAGFEARGAQWDQELARRRQVLDDEIAQQRRQRLLALDAELLDERKRRAALLAREQETLDAALEARATAQATRFAALLLQRLSGPELQHRIVGALLEDLAGLPTPRRDDLRAAMSASPDVVVASAVALAEDDRSLLEDALRAIAVGTVAPRYELDPELLSGARINIGSWELEASLGGELHAFAALTEHE